MDEELKGTLVRFRYKSPKNTWKIADLKLPNGAIVILKGFIADANLDFDVRLTGQWVEDPKYGRQFEVSSCVREVPKDLGGTVRWLANKKVRGLGPAIAKSLADAFGADLPNIIEKNHQMLARVPKVSMNLANAINEAWTKDAQHRDVGILLAEGGISETKTTAVIAEFGQNSVSVIMDNPYRLTAITGIAFKSADKMALSRGWSLQRPERVEAAISYQLLQAVSEGHTYLPRPDLIDQVRKLACSENGKKSIPLPAEDAIRALDRVVERGEVKVEKVTVAGKPTHFCYHPKYYELEREVAKRTSELLMVPCVPPRGLQEALKKVEEKLHLELSDRQRDAVVTTFEHNCSVITGLPGTGKTSTVRALIETATQLKLRVLLAAPTGRAAKRLSEVTGKTATTIHRMLGFIPETNSFAFNKRNPLECDMLILDEASMIDIELMAYVLNAVSNDTSVVWIGDVNQLPSVGAGMVLRDLINSNRVYVTTLDKIFRQAAGSLIIRNAHRIFQGDMPQFPTKGQQGDSFWIEVPRAKNEAGNTTDDVEFVKRKLVDVYGRLRERYNFDPVRDIQILTPMRVGPVGYPVFNSLIQDVVNPDGEVIEIRDQVFRVGDRVMQMKNDYEIEVFNGDVGFIQSINVPEKTIKIEFFDRTVNYPFESVDNLSLSYAVTIHKSQGSEFKVVVLIMMSHHHVMLDRNLLYTANTRGKEMVIFLASRGALEVATRTQNVLKRNSFLGQRIRLHLPKAETTAKAA